jgi:phospholipid/cholesterol/gamma-HCH transport system substrate-binding protein
MNQETKVGFFLIASIAAILAGILFLGNLKIFSHDHRFHVMFDNVEALPPKAAVKVAGVEIGKVRHVELVGGRARVTIDIDPKVAVYENATASVGSTGIIGTKFIELKPGGAPAPELKDGANIEGLSERSLNEMISKLSSLFENDDQYGNAVTNLKETIANIRNVSRALNIAMGEHGSDMEAIVMNVRDLTDSLKTFSGHLAEISTEHKEDIKVAIEKFRDVGEKLDSILAKIQEGKGVIGTLVNDDQAGKDTKEAVANIKDTAKEAKKFFGRISSMNVYWNYRYRYDTREGEGRSDLGLKFVPRPGKFYAFGVTNLGNVPENEKHTQFERKNKVTAVMGADLGPFTGYAGAVRSDGGLGLNFRPLFWDPELARRFELTAEATEFKREREVNGQLLDKPWLAFGAHIAATRWLWLGARVEDVLEHSAFMAYTNITFRDEDIAALLGLAAVAR